MPVETRTQGTKMEEQIKQIMAMLVQMDGRNKNWMKK